MENGVHNRNSVLMAGVPRTRGRPAHFEHTDDEINFTVLSGGEVLAVHTTQEPFTRLHEYLHALHTDEEQDRRDYRRVEWLVGQITADCALHLEHWPWPPGETPAPILQAVEAYHKNERKRMARSYAKHPENIGNWADFAVRLRQVSVVLATRPMTSAGNVMMPSDAIKLIGFTGRGQAKLALKVITMIQAGKHREAAECMQFAFFGPLINSPAGGGYVDKRDYDDDNDAKTDVPPWQNEDASYPRMDIIELPHTVRIKEAKIGYRRATTGPRLHRPSLRKPILPQRLFIKRTRVEPGGTIVIDASGSMGSFDRVTEQVERAPFATVAYYAGCGEEYGQLFIYARNGRRAVEPQPPDGGDNTIDGNVLDWLLQQKAPRILITDLGFCGASDSIAQIVRAERLARQGVIQIRDYLD